MKATYRKLTDETIAQLNAAFAKGDDVPTVAKKFDLSPGVGEWYYQCFMLPARERITWKSDKDLAAKIVKARATGMDFVAISMRTGVPYQECRRIAFANGGSPRVFGKNGQKRPAAEPPGNHVETHAVSKPVANDKHEETGQEREPQPGRRWKFTNRPIVHEVRERSRRDLDSTEVRAPAARIDSREVFHLFRPARFAVADENRAITESGDVLGRWRRQDLVVADARYRACRAIGIE